MDYSKHYNTLINRAKFRLPDINTYYEKHHIIPRCMQGTDDTSNIVLLTGREHFIAHQLLVKMYPGNHSLIKAANAMCQFSNIMLRSENRRYDWLRHKLSHTMSVSQTGDGNSQYGKIWITHKLQKCNKKIALSELAKYTKDGWEAGRSIKWKTKCCVICNTVILSSSARKKYCSDQCKKSVMTNVFTGREQELITYYHELGSINKAVKAMGLPGAMGSWFIFAKQILYPDVHDKTH